MELFLSAIQEIFSTVNSSKQSQEWIQYKHLHTKQQINSLNHKRNYLEITITTTKPAIVYIFIFNIYVLVQTYFPYELTNPLIEIPQISVISLKFHGSATIFLHLWRILLFKESFSSRILSKDLFNRFGLQCKGYLTKAGYGKGYC